MTVPVDFPDLDGWATDGHAEALAAFRTTCDLMASPSWRGVAEAAASATDPRQFFETRFRPVRIGDGEPTLFTGYYEPVLRGSCMRDDRFRHPVHALPPDLPETGPWLARRDLLGSGVLEGRGLELAWFEDPADAFFLQVQGSGRVALGDGTTLRLGYAGTNGHPYRSIGRELVRRGILDEATVSAEAIRHWLRTEPVAGAELLLHNPSYVFFRVRARLPPDLGPLGTMQRPVTAMRTLAVDPEVIPLGAPVWIETDGPAPLRRLMIAQDTGSAIKGAHRADIFIGTGEAAGRRAGALRETGRMLVLLPRRGERTR
jgi:membrane-bound lytic murein transglycosylase A